MLFRKKTVRSLYPPTPPEVIEARKEVHDAAEDAQEKVAKMNTVWMNGITVRIYHATGGKKR